MPRPPAPQVKPVASRGPSMGLIGGVVVLAVLLIAALVWAATRGSGLDATGSTSTLPEGGGVSVGPGVDADVMQIRVYEDPQCPWCARLENSIGQGLDDLVASGEANVTYQIMSFLDGGGSDRSSSRAANAMLCADEAGRFTAFHGELFADPAAQAHQGYTDDQLMGWARSAGISGDAEDTFATCIAEEPHQDYVRDMQERANKDGVTGTPTVFVNGEELSNEEISLLLEDGSQLEQVLQSHA